MNDDERKLLDELAHNCAPFPVWRGYSQYCRLRLDDGRNPSLPGMAGELKHRDLLRQQLVHQLAQTRALPARLLGKPLVHFRVKLNGFGLAPRVDRELHRLREMPVVAEIMRVPKLADFDVARGLRDAGFTFAFHSSDVQFASYRIALSMLITSIDGNIEYRTLNTECRIKRL